MDTLDHALTEILKTLDDARALDDLQAVSEELRDIFDVSHVIYHWVSAKGDQYGCGTYDRAWAKRYVAQGYLRVDPVIRGCYQRYNPVDWRTLDWTPKPVRNFMAEAAEYGVGHQGYSIPIHGPHGQFALFTVSDHRNDADWDAFTATHRRGLILMAHAFNERALAFEPAREAVSAPLSPREVDTMTFLAMGYSRAQVADMLSISEHTVRDYVESSRLKLGAANTLQAVTKAIARGMIVV